MAQVIAPLAELGRRIAIIGTSNAGKSTLAAAIGQKTGLPPVFLDQLRFVPGSDWAPRPAAEFEREHDTAVTRDEWVIEGNYKALMPARLARATGVVMLWDGRWPSFFRYVRRTLFERERAGMLEGGRDSLKWDMIHWILIVQPGRRELYEAMARDTGLPIVFAHGMRQVQALYEAWGLRR